MIKAYTCQLSDLADGGFREQGIAISLLRSKKAHSKPDLPMSCVRWWYAVVFFMDNGLIPHCGCDFKAFIFYLHH